MRRANEDSAADYVVSSLSPGVSLSSGEIIARSSVFPNARKISPLLYALESLESRVIWHVYHRSK